VAAHDRGRVVDVNDALEEGPFSPERAGTLPTLQLLRLAAEHQNDFTRLRRLINGRGGLYAYTGTTDCSRIEEEAAKRPDYRELLQAMGYQIAKAMAALAASLEGRVDALVVTGGLARSDILMGEIRRRVGFVAPLMVYAGEFELQALAAGVLRVLRGEEEPRHYTKEESQDAAF
jgi:butyrate kinase